MGSSQRRGGGAMFRVAGPKIDKGVPMECMQIDRLINSFIEPKKCDHHGPPKATAGTGGFKLKKGTK